jgi:hypothetical protein
LCPWLGEWGYQFANFNCQTQAACCNLSSPSYPLPPASREDARLRMQAYFVCRQREAVAFESRSGRVPEGFGALNGHYFYFHHAVNFGASEGGRPVTSLSSEVAENINSINAHLAFLRGAARQYSIKSWEVDVSPWFRGMVPDFANASAPWAAASSAAGPHGGHSVSMLRRVYFAVAAAGAQRIEAETADCYAFLPRADPATGAFSRGRVCR